jgi:hypothetical protein
MQTLLMSPRHPHFNLIADTCCTPHDSRESLEGIVLSMQGDICDAIIFHKIE